MKRNLSFKDSKGEGKEIDRKKIIEVIEIIESIESKKWREMREKKEGLQEGSMMIMNWRQLR